MWWISHQDGVGHNPVGGGERGVGHALILTPTPDSSGLPAAAPPKIFGTVFRECGARLLLALFELPVRPDRRLVIAGCADVLRSSRP
jgi:hypothetical protein